MNMKNVVILRSGMAGFGAAYRLVYANAIFDLARATSLPTVHGYLNHLGIACCGRYGDWESLSTDQLVISGEDGAQRMLDRAGR